MVKKYNMASLLKRDHTKIASNNLRRNNLRYMLEDVYSLQIRRYCLCCLPISLDCAFATASGDMATDP